MDHPEIVVKNRGVESEPPRKSSLARKRSNSSGGVVSTSAMNHPEVTFFNDTESGDDGGQIEGLVASNWTDLYETVPVSPLKESGEEASRLQAYLNLKRARDRSRSLPNVHGGRPQFVLVNRDFNNLESINEDADSGGSNNHLNRYAGDGESIGRNWMESKGPRSHSKFDWGLEVAVD